MLLFIIAVIISIIFFCWLYSPEISTATQRKSNLPKDFEPTPIDAIHQAADLRILREGLNSIDLSAISKEKLIYKLKKIDEKVPNQDFFDYNALMEQISYEEFLKALQQAKDILNSLDLDNRTTVTQKELLDSIDETSGVQEITEEGFEDDEEDFEDEISGLATIAGAIFGDDNKTQRINQKRELLAKLQREHGFAKSYAPNWDPSEGLYSKYDDEEKYLDAKIEEVKQKNLSYDMYLTEEEKRMFKDDTSPGYWEE